MIISKHKAKSAQLYFEFRARGKPKKPLIIPAGITMRPSQTWMGVNLVGACVCL